MDTLDYITHIERTFLRDYLRSNILPIFEGIPGPTGIVNDKMKQTLAKLNLDVSILPPEPQATFLRLGGQHVDRTFYKCLTASGCMTLKCDQSKSTFIVIGTKECDDFFKTLDQECLKVGIKEPHLHHVIEYFQHTCIM
jgi:hypothetical protein